jgi:hypothetical protein
MAVLTSLIVLCLLVSTAFSVLEFDIDFSLSGGKIDNFWSSTGLTPQSPCDRDMVVELMLSLDVNTQQAFLETNTDTDHVFKDSTFTT